MQVNDDGSVGFTLTDRYTGRRRLLATTSSTTLDGGGSTAVMGTDTQLSSSTAGSLDSGADLPSQPCVAVLLGLALALVLFFA